MKMKIEKDKTLTTERMLCLGAYLLEGVLESDAEDEIGTEGKDGVLEGIVLTISALYGAAIGMTEVELDVKKADEMLGEIRQLLITMAILQHGRGR